MKKLIAMLLAVILVMGLVACGAEENTNTPATPSTSATTEAPKKNSEATATEMLSPIWKAVPEENRFFAMGGDFSAPVDNDAGNYSLEDEGLTASLMVPADQIPNLLNAASLMHAMMANNFTCGMYQVSVEADVNAFAEAMKASFSNAQWICGQPEKMLIAVVNGEYVLAAFGINDAINPFETALTATYPDATIVCSEAIAG